MTTPARGFGLSLGLAEEVTWGTALARTNWLRMRTATLTRTREKTVVDHLGSFGAASTNPREHFVSNDNVGGDISWICAYDDSTLLLLKHLLGAVITSGIGPFVHAVTLASPPPTGLTLELIRATPGSGGADTAEVFEGCKLASGSLEVSAGALMTAQATVIGQTSGGLVAAGTPTYSANGQPIAFNHAGQLSWNALTFDVRSMTLNIDRSLERQQELGSLFTQEPVEGRLAITIDVELMWRSNGLYDGLLAGTQSDLAITFLGTGNNQLAVTAHNAIVMTAEQPTQGAGVVSQRVQFMAFADAADQGLLLSFTNDNTTAEAN